MHKNTCIAKERLRTCFRRNRVHADIRTSIKTTHLVSNTVIVVQASVFTLFCYFNDIWWRAGLFVQRPLLDFVTLVKSRIVYNGGAKTSHQNETKLGSRNHFTQLFTFCVVYVEQYG